MGGLKDVDRTEGDGMVVSARDDDKFPYLPNATEWSCSNKRGWFYRQLFAKSEEFEDNLDLNMTPPLIGSALKKGDITRLRLRICQIYKLRNTAWDVCCTIQHYGPSYEVDAKWLAKIPASSITESNKRPRGMTGYFKGPVTDNVTLATGSTTKQQSEQIARKSLQEPTIGFGGEWSSWNPIDRTLLKQVFSVMQNACENKIALLHLALPAGDEPEDLIAPSLCKVIESQDIVKTGVKIQGAGFDRLRRYFKLNSQRSFELNDLHNVVTKRRSNGLSLVALAKQVEYHLGLPLYQGDEVGGRLERATEEGSRVEVRLTTYAYDFTYQDSIRIERRRSSPTPKSI
ncbi:hypothetical protein DL765_003237 [Monosporascus sp. GIB2]|nr:hypothetical protein DL765_003237 [Monosporascus sp. GIB2]